MVKKSSGPVPTRIRQEARRQRIHQTRLAAEIGLTQSSMARKLNGSTPITVPEAEALARFLNVSISWLFGEEWIRVNVHEQAAATEAKDS